MKHSDVMRGLQLIEEALEGKCTDTSDIDVLIKCEINHGLNGKQSIVGTVKAGRGELRVEYIPK